MDDRARDYKVLETPAGRCYQKPEPPTVEYAVMSDEELIPRQERTYATLKAAYFSKRAADWVVALENGWQRPFTADEQDELRRYLHDQ